MRRANGAVCLADRECLTGHCRDGRCCDLACTSPCSRCDKPGREGFCTPVAAGAAPPASKSCAREPETTCGRDGTCDGLGSCRRWPAGTICKPAVCEPQSTRLRLAWLCDGAGSCAAFAPDALDCAPYGCDETTQRCFASCTDAAMCKKGASCDSGRCDGSGAPLGAACSAGVACGSGSCVEGVCCSDPCSGTCETCALEGAAGRCVPVPAGRPPPAGKSCPVDAASLCGNDGTCDGKRKCRLAPPTKACGATTCNQSRLTRHVCNSDPAGPTCVKEEISCGSYACQPSGTSCYEACATAAECAAGKMCVNNQCV
jgi:hypothetical protein